MFMRDVISDWNRWSKGERLFAGVLTLGLSIAALVLTHLS
jgi:hypothetical protein